MPRLELEKSSSLGITPGRSTASKEKQLLSPGSARARHTFLLSMMPLRPHVPAAAPAHQFPFPGVRVGVAEYEDGPTGITLFHFPERAFAVVDVRGGSPGTCFTDALRMSYGKFVSGIAFC